MEEVTKETVHGHDVLYPTGSVEISAEATVEMSVETMTINAAQNLESRLCLRGLLHATCCSSYSGKSNSRNYS